MPIKHNKGETYVDGMTLRWPKYGSTKLDGIRVSGQDGTLITNAGKGIPNKDIVERFAPIIQGLDGELIYGESNHELVYNRTYSAVMRKHSASAENITFYAFDTLNMEKPFEDRYNDLKALAPNPYIKVLDQHLLTSEDQLHNYYAWCLEKGYEGVILRNLTAMYKQGRSTLASEDLIKLKPFKDSEAVVLSVYEAMHNGNTATIDAHGHTTRSTHAENKTPLGMLGGFIVRDLHTGVEFNCAPGKSSHKEREFWWSIRDSLPGKIIKYKYLDIGTLNKPRLNGFIGWRDSVDI